MKDAMSMLLMPLGGKTHIVLCIYVCVYGNVCILQGTFPVQKFVCSCYLYIFVSTTGHHYTMQLPLPSFNVCSVWLLMEHWSMSWTMARGLLFIMPVQVTVMLSKPLALYC